MLVPQLSTPGPSSGVVGDLWQNIPSSPSSRQRIMPSSGEPTMGRQARRRHHLLNAQGHRRAGFGRWCRQSSPRSLLRGTYPRRQDCERFGTPGEKPGPAGTRGCLCIVRLPTMQCGHTASTLADLLHVSKQCVYGYSSIYRKLNLRNRLELIAWCRENRLESVIRELLPEDVSRRAHARGLTEGPAS